MLSKMKNKFFFTVPISVKVTAWYTFFLGTLLAIMFGVAFALADKILDDVSQKELIKSVDKVASKPKSFESYDDGIFFIKYDKENDKILGLVPPGFDRSLKFSPNKVNIEKQKGNKYYYYDMKIKESSDEWIRGVFPVSRVSRDVKKFLIILSVMTPFLFVFIIYGGYRIIKNGFKPVRIIADTALEIQKNRDFSRRINIGQGRDEIHKIAVSFNRILDSLEDSYIHEKQFSSDVSHELKTPISVILAESDYALEHIDNVDEARESFAVISRQSKKMRELLFQIVELSKLEQEKKIVFKEIDFSKLLEDMENDYQILFKEKNINLKFKIEKNVQILGDELLIERVVDNLLSNALKFARDKVTVTLEMYNNCLLKVQDNGIGIDEKEQNKIWDRFYQVEQSRNKKNNSGYGLGLSMVSTIVKLHGGRIFLNSSIGNGATFIVELPLKR